MTPLWQDARRRGARVLSCDHEFHATDDAELFVAVFTLDVAVGERTASLPFVQLIRIRDGLIAEVREFFSPQFRTDALEAPTQR